MTAAAIRPRDITAALRALSPHSAGGVETRGGAQPGEFVATISLEYAQYLGVSGADGGGAAGLAISRQLGARVHITAVRGLRPYRGRGYRAEVTLRLHMAAWDEVFAQLIDAGYGKDAAVAVMSEAEQFPTRWAYTEDRHRGVVFTMPGGTWEVADTAEAEDRIAAYRTRRGQLLRAQGRTP